MTTPIPSADDAVVVRAADAETLGHPDLVTIRLLTDAVATGDALSAVRVTLAEGVDGAAPHHHAGSAELFYVLDGQVQVLVGDRVLTVEQGDLAVVPHHLPHAFGVAPGHTADLLIVIAPGVDRFEYFRTLERIAYGTVPPDVLLAEQDRYDTWFLESTVWQEARARGPSPPCAHRSGRGCLAHTDDVEHRARRVRQHREAPRFDLHRRHHHRAPQLDGSGDRTVRVRPR